MANSSDPASRPRLRNYLPAGKIRDADQILNAFLAWLATTGLEPYPAQEEAVLELMAGRHVILNTPTGSGKSLVALAVHFKAVCERLRSFYTSPIKALVSEKFFDLCEELGPENVGMMTGDASINPKAPVICCTAEVLANLALREGPMTPADYIVMDEFHFYSDPDRGMAWQIPLVTVPHARFLLMSATLAELDVFVEGIGHLTGVDVSVVRSDQRPVPLEWEWRETPLHETISDLSDRSRAPIYVVAFTQRECAETAQNMLSVNLCTKDEKAAIAEAIGGVRFDTPFGQDVKKLVRHGIGIHHAGLLPKYRTLVERLAQRGLLKLIAGTDTLGVGVNVPIRTVLFTKLCKFDGEKTRILTVRDFKQIAGRAGRKGYDVRGWIVAQAPEHVIENRRLEAKAGKDGKRKFVRKQPPQKGYVPWDEKTFEKLRTGEAEALQSRFGITHGILLTVLHREIDPQQRDGGYRRIVDLITHSYERPALRSRHRRHAATLLRHLRHAGIVELVPHAVGGRPALRVAQGLQRDFSLHHTLSLYLLEVLEQLEPTSPSYALDVLSLVEAIVEHPQAILLRQVDRIKTDLIGELKAAGVEYEQRMAELEQVEHPKPLAELLYRTFDAFRDKHPWVAGENVRPKSIARDLIERYAGFNAYIKYYGLARSEGVLLRYLTQVYKALVQNVPETHKDDAVRDVEAYLFALISRVDATLLHEWERMLAVASGDVQAANPHDERPVVDLAADPKRFGSRVRAELHALVHALAQGDWAEALTLLVADDATMWDEIRLQAELQPMIEECGTLEGGHRARLTHLTDLRPLAPRQWQARQTLVGPDGDTSWMLDCEIKLDESGVADGPLLRLLRISA